MDQVNTIKRLRTKLKYDIKDRAKNIVYSKILKQNLISILAWSFTCFSLLNKGIMLTG